jgi:glycosyltransferase involved in cell wall biosynthesis
MTAAAGEISEITMTAPRNKLLFFVTEDWYFVAHRLALAVAAKEAGYAVSVVTRVRKHGDIIRAAGLMLIPFENSRRSLNPFGELWTLLRLTRLSLRERPDVVHHVAIKPVLYGSIAARIARTPRVINALAGMGWLVTTGGGMTRWLKPAVRRALGLMLRSGTVLVENPDDARTLVRMGVPEGRIRRLAGSGVDLQRFSPHPEPDGIPVVLLSARLLWHKGVGEFVDSARLLKQRGINARFLLAGEPDLGNAAAIPREQIDKWVAEGVVEYLGWVQDMPRLLAGSCIVCLPSYYGEGIPMALIEAAAAGRPIVTTDMPGCREAVHDGDNGLLVPPQNVPALAEALARLIEDPKLRREMGGRGRLRAEREFGAAHIIAQTLQLYAAPND